MDTSELRAERIRIDKAITAIESLNNAGSFTGRRGGPAAKRSRRRMSAAGRKRLSELMKNRPKSGSSAGHAKSRNVR